MSYDPGAKVSYGKDSNSATDIVPAPQISFNTEMVYANDSVSGYSYTFTLNGNATALNLVTNNNGSGLKDTISSIEKIRSIFSLNGGSLYVKNSDDNTILECRGGIIKSIVFNESGNNWFNYAPYKVDIEFNEVLINGCNVNNTISCNNLSINSNSLSSNLIDISKYKIKSFNDGWSFNISDQSYNSYSFFQNQYIDIEYKISVTGKHFYNDNQKLLPAWEQAKNFAQDRLYNQVKGLIGNILNRGSGTDGCSGGQSPNNLYPVSSPGGIDGISSSTHKIYNETISCEVGEAEGTFSATYKAILKYSSNNNLIGVDCIHTFNNTKSVQDDGRSRTISLSVQGNITGLIPGGLINNPNTIQLPKNGKLFINNNSSITKYSKALTAYKTIIVNGDIDPQIKDIMDITMETLEVQGSCIDPASYPPAVSFTATHDYTGGNISYSVEYNSNRACQNNRSYRNITISVEDSTPIIAEFVVPGRANGPIIQKINADTPKRVNVSIEGVVDPKCCADIANEVANICGGLSLLPNDLPPAIINNMKLTQNQETVNIIDGSYSINRAYISLI